MNTHSTTRRRESATELGLDPLGPRHEHTVVANDGVLEQAWTQWRFGDWQSLAAIDWDRIQDHPARSKLAVFAAAGHLQIGNANAARELIGLARDLVDDDRFVAQILLAGVSNSLGRASLVAGDQARALKHFEAATAVGVREADARLVTQARIYEQVRQVGAGRGVKPTLTGNLNERDVGGFSLSERLMWESTTIPYLFSLALSIDGAGCFCLFNHAGVDCFELHDGVLAYDIPTNSPLYFVTTSSGAFQNPKIAQFKPTPGFEYKIEGQIDHSSGTPPVFWIFQYRRGARIASNNISVGNGKFLLRVAVRDDADALAFGIRLGGKGQINLSKSRLRVSSSRFSVENTGREWIQEVCKREFESQSFLRFNERPVEFSFLFRVVAEHYPKRIIDVGTGLTALPHLLRNCGPLVTAIDNVRDYWTDDVVNRHYHVINDDVTQTRLNTKFDLVSCISVLEHIEKHEDAVRTMADLLDELGLLVITCPYTDSEYVRNVYELPGSSYGQSASYITQSFSRADIVRWCETLSLELVEQEYWCFWSGEYWTVGQQIIPPIKTTADQKHQLTCLLFRKIK